MRQYMAYLPRPTSTSIHSTVLNSARLSRQASILPGSFSNSSTQVPNFTPYYPTPLY